MPELPDIAIYIEALERRILGQALKQAKILSPFLLRTAMRLTAAIMTRTSYWL